MRGLFFNYYYNYKHCPLCYKNIIQNCRAWYYYLSLKVLWKHPTCYLRSCNSAKRNSRYWKYNVFLGCIYLLCMATLVVDLVSHLAAEFQTSRKAVNTVLIIFSENLFFGSHILNIFSYPNNGRKCVHIIAKVPKTTKYLKWRITRKIEKLYTFTSFF